MQLKGETHRQGLLHDFNRNLNNQGGDVSGTALQSSPGDGVPTGSFIEGSSEETCSDALTSDDISSDHPVLVVAAPCVGEHDVGSFPRPLAVLEDAPIEVIVANAFSESQPLSVTSRESPKLLVSLHLPESKTTSFVKDPLHIEGQHIPSCAGEVLEVVPSGLPSEAAAEDDSACRIAADTERLRKQLMEIKEQCCLDLQLPCCTSAAHKSGPDGSYSGSVAALQDVSLCGANASPSCHQGPPARWIDEELFARQEINGRFPKAR
ncbi:hypothetical protein Nepgr_013438 [Nepenthes gracilis]|uniref:Uncharacterized protein n=1 Tax=Nepenthes gracilis TaxID=150966 RepID=A0AAD3SJ49_NEPGR|nr:hypothetical protein Nepgr_013438 [Nepenthes gracilis]